MKSIEQTNRYLSSCVFDDNDWSCVLDFCRKNFGGGKVHRPKRGCFHTSFADFIAWFKYMPGQGDIVQYGDIIGMIGKCTPSDYELCVYMGHQEQLIAKPLVVFPHNLVIASTEKAYKLIFQMFNAGITYSIRLGMLTNLYIPDNGDFVMVKHSGSVKYGIFDHVENLNCVFYYLDNKENDITPITIPFFECEIERASLKAKMELLEKLSCIGVTWSAKERVFLPMPLKVEYGGKYWYISDRFCIHQTKDMKTLTHKERYKSGNYFTTYAEALIFLKRLKELCKELNKGLNL